MSRIAIVGPGAVGSVLAALLHETGRHELTLCARRPVPAIRVRRDLTVIEFAPAVVTDPLSAPAVDWVLIVTKAYDSASAARWLPRLCAAGAAVAVVQNGVEHRERFAGAVAPGRLLPVMVDAPAERNDQGVVQRGAARLVVADSALGRDFVALFAGTTADAGTTKDFTTAVWRKLCLNAAGVVSALTLRPAGVLRLDEAATLAREIVRECAAVARAEGAAFADDVVEATLAACRAAPIDGVNSLLADRLAGRPTEIDARNGVIVRLGRKHGIPTPCNAMAVALFNVMTAAESSAPLTSMSGGGT
ncbi:MAG TPA: 2-dehydropantoate 2-reductase [Opitutaceae bacterium]|nr:2-dehydropantoate 2-reductase [Opitutaceae bacterium]